MKYLPLLLLVIIAGCETNPPDAIDYNILTTKVFINSNVTGAGILVDNNTTGKFTPDTINLSEGVHNISLNKDGYIPKDTVITVQGTELLNVYLTLREAAVSKLVLVEDFANVSCDPCVVSNNIIHSLASYAYKNKIAVIKYPTYWPGANDPFYLAAKSESDARIQFYNVIVAPTVWVDGLTKPVPSDSNKIKPAIEGQLSKTPRFKIEVTKNIAGEVLSSDVNVTFIDTAGLNFSDLVLQTVVVESEIEFSSPPGSNGETKFYHVMRSMLPSFNGEVLKNQEFLYQRSVTCSPAWNKSKLNIIAFIQNKITKEVYQTGTNQ